MTVFGSIDDVPFEVTSPAGWRMQRGTKPYVKVVELDRKKGLAIFGLAHTLGSQITLGVGEVEQTYTALTILGTSPSLNPNTIRLDVADRRWLWPYFFVARSYNVPRKSPNNRRAVVGFQGEPDLPADLVKGLRQAVDDKEYAEYSLKDGKRWTGRQILEDVLNLVVGVTAWEIKVTDTLLAERVENLVLNSQGDTALQQVFAALGGGVDVWINHEGKAIVYTPQDGQEVLELGLVATRERNNPGAREIMGKPLAELQDNRKVRPRSYEVYFGRVVEARVDFTEGKDLVAITRTARDPIVSPTAFNVFPAPEDGIVPALGGRKAREVIKGTWLTLEDLLGMYAADAKGNLLAIKLALTSQIIEKLWFSNGLNAYAHPAYDKGKVWERRISVIREHWRRTYQLQRPWIDRVIDIQPFRVALEDAESGARAPALVFQDYTVIFAWDPNLVGIDADDQERALAQSKYANEDAIGVGGSIVGTDIKDLRTAPATVRILDKDQGIVQINMRDDWTGWADRYERTATVPLNNPNGNPKPKDDFEAREILMDDEQASTGHEVSIVLTFAMGAPNDLRRFHKVTVTHAQAAELVADNIQGAEGEGPVLQIKYGAPRAVARHAWRDDKSEQFNKLFSGGWLGAFPDIGDPLNQAQLATIAKAVAARELSRHADHPEGAVVKDYTPGARIVGAVSAVEHEFETGPGGGAFTLYELDPSPPPIDPKATIPDDVRRVIEGFVDSP